MANGHKVLMVLRANGIAPTPTYPVTPVRSDAIQAVLEHFWHDEERHFLECGPEDRRNHVFLRLLEIAAHVYGDVVLAPEIRNILREWNTEAPATV